MLRFLLVFSDLRAVAQKPSITTDCKFLILKGRNSRVGFAHKQMFVGNRGRASRTSLHFSEYRVYQDLALCADKLVDSHKERTTRYIAIHAVAIRAFLVGRQPDRYHVLFLIARATDDSYEGPVMSTTDQHVRSDRYFAIHQKPAYFVGESYASLRKARSVYSCFKFPIWTTERGVSFHSDSSQRGFYARKIVGWWQWRMGDGNVGRQRK